MTHTSVLSCDVAVLGSGPGGYTAAFRAADLGQNVVLIERYDHLGGVCLNVGCIPTKTYVHAAEVIENANEMSDKGLNFAAPEIDITKLRAWKNRVVGRLTMGLKSLAKRRKVDVVQGVGQFISPTEIEVKHGNETTMVKFKNAIIAVGSEPRSFPFFPNDPRMMDSTTALELEAAKGKLLIIGAGIIGLEMALIYDSLGAEVTLVEPEAQIMPMTDADVVMPLARRIQKKYKDIFLETYVTAIEAKDDGLYVTFEGKHAADEPRCFDYVLYAVGRVPNGASIGADKAGVHVDERGFIPVDAKQRTNVSHIFAIGDVVGNPMLAHKAIPEGRVAAEVIAGENVEFKPKCIPSVAYTDPEIAWVGMTEKEAKAAGLNYKKAVFPWMASGRATSIGRNEGMTKLLFDEENKKLIGGAIVGPHAGELISEVSLAIEKDCSAPDIASTIHPHPTLSETIMMAAEVYEGTVTDM